MEYNKLSERNKNQSQLYVTLPVYYIQRIQETIQSLNGITTLSANQMLNDLKIYGINSKLFSALKIFIPMVEGFSPTIYLVDADMTMGIGLDLTVNNPSALALFYQAAPDHDWKALSPDILNK